MVAFWFGIEVLLSGAFVNLHWRLEPAATRVQTTVSLTLQATIVLEMLIIAGFLRECV